MKLGTSLPDADVDADAAAQRPGWLPHARLVALDEALRLHPDL